MADDSPDAVFYHTLSVLHSPSYRDENAGALRQDWPRVPLPSRREDLLASAELGRQVAALLDVEQTVAEVTTGALRRELRLLGRVERLPGLIPGEPDLNVTAGWGHAGQAGVCMPGQGKLVRRDYEPEELAALQEGARSLGLPVEQALSLLGDSTLDVYLNDQTYWKNVPSRVWSYTLGGYQVVKKWISYREHSLLCRPLRPNEARHVTAMVRRIAALLLLEPELDANYERAKASPFPWVGGGPGGL